MLIATVIGAIIGAIFGTQAGGAATQTPAEAAHQIFVVMNAAIDRSVDDDERKAEAKQLLGEVEKEMDVYGRSTLRLEREAFWRVDSDYASTADDYAPVLKRLDDGWVGLLYYVSDKRDAFAEIFTDEEWKAFNEEVGKWYAEQRPKMMEALDVDNIEDERTKAVAGAARVVSP